MPLGQRLKKYGQYRNKKITGMISQAQKDYNATLDKENQKYKLTFPVDCIKLDSYIIEIESRIAELTKKNVQGLSSSERNTLGALMEIRPKKKLEFFKYDCANVLESKKLLESKNLLDSEFLKNDIAVLPTANKNQNILLAIGGLAILAALIIVLKNK